ncbi:MULTISPECIES: hypothetical protein [Cytobacillus]|uniref:Uncharacterized protein n=1 Tax=Cytobacillus pseudoceanisediminis TaxID=3051614 RepID=A0ABZ2ZNN5_9BACI|nr:MULTISPECIES: hypothetical protein [Cytobacillus]MCS0823283.1 hypothetical protein [Cytobacillus firmus]MBU8733360.1 hypothetical protein [Cytobacillus oceanisediminis]MBU8768165.1 hypothetical protein [Cytobacillus oceanisediminis]MCM3241442.1 hypothetical protein [Cytobacillus oceanisediminis]MCM3392014.1 hypothetical protein [Cytobacillus oceanisediminis]
MKKLPVLLMLMLILLSFILNIFGLMKLIPIFITSPILFISLLILFLYLNDRRRFKGF